MKAIDREQNNGEIRARGDATVSLPGLRVWQGSSAVFFVYAPDDAEAVSLSFGGASFAGAYERSARRWRIYLAPDATQDAGAYRYAVGATDGCGNPTILGRGDIAVVAT